jgi:isopentenyl diphosphate isomerase/L-lactate dehydrogenase-like FMN-dependent dehydrogenase
LSKGPLRGVYNLDDLRKVAQRRLPKSVYEVIAGGSGDDLTLRGNRSALESIWLRPRNLADVSTVDTSTTVLGDRISMPLMLDPCSFARMCNSQAELGVARAAGRAGTIYAIAGGASEKPEDIAKVATGPLWYQLYMNPDDGLTRDLLDRVEGAGYRVLCVTVDTMIKPYRETDLRNGISLPMEITPKLIMAGLSRPAWAREFLMGKGGTEHNWRAAQVAYDHFTEAIRHIKSVTLNELAWLRERWKGPLLVKGVLRGDEVPAMIDAGVDGIVVSNHGGRNLDGVPPTISALPEVVEAADGRAEVFMDGGIRRGTDVVKALALGAQAVLMGRPYLYGLAANGEEGVDQALELMRNEIHRAMAFCGAPTVADIDASMVSVGLPGATVRGDAAVAGV